MIDAVLLQSRDHLAAKSCLMAHGNILPPAVMGYRYFEQGVLTRQLLIFESAPSFSSASQGKGTALVELVDGEVLRIEDKFKRAGLMLEYTTIYAELCSHSHNTLQALRGRHIEETESNYEIVFYRLTSLDEVEHYLGIACTLLLEATERVHAFLGNPCVEQIIEARKRMDIFVKEHEAA